MKNYFKLMSLFLGLLMGCFAFVACGDDDDDENGTPNTPALTSITEQDLYGGWYGIDENSNEKINIFEMVFEPQGRGFYAEIKAKANHDWEPEEESVDMTWTLNKGTITMTFQVEDGSETRVGDILAKNQDGSMKIRRHLENNKTDEMIIYPLTDHGVWRIFEELLMSKTGGK